MCPFVVFTFQTQGWWCWVSSGLGRQLYSFPVISLCMDHTEQEREHKLKQKVRTGAVCESAAFIAAKTDEFSHCHYCLWAAGQCPGRHRSWPDTPEVHYLAALWTDGEEEQHLGRLVEGTPWMNPAGTRTQIWFYFLSLIPFKNLV